MRFRYKALSQLIALIFLDLVAYYSALFLAVFTRTNIVQFFYQDVPTFGFDYAYFASIWWIPLVYIIIIQFDKLYIARYPFWEESKVILKAVTIAIVFVFLNITVRNMYGNISRSVFFFLWLFLIIALPVVRYWGKRLLYKIGIWKEKVLIIGSGESAIMTILGLSNEEHLGYSVIGFLDDDPEKIGTSIKVKNKEYRVYGNIKNFEKFVNLLKIETIIIANPSVTQDELTDLVNEIYKHVRRVIVIPDIKGIAIFNSELQYLFMERLFMIKVNNNLNSDTNRFIKRVFDLILSIFGFLLISPVYLVIAILIKFSSKGPVFFSHKRVGKEGKEFDALKFRTMYLDADKRLKHILKTNPEAKKEWEQNYKLKNDPRVTPIGRFLRKTSLDELPQIFNIIKGDMSLVGPRPVIREEIEKHYGSFKGYYYSVLPGLTGLWQVSGRSDTDYNFRIQTDVWYVQNWSMWLDVIILFKTIPVVFKREGAY